MRYFLSLCLLLISPTFYLIPALAQNPAPIESDPQQLQQQAIARIEQYREQFRKTGDFTSLRPELEKADQELAKSAELFRQRKDPGNAALSLIKRGDAITAMLNRREQAVEPYQQALQLARQADHKNYQAKALVGLGRAKKILGQFDEAAQFYQEAVTLSESSGNKENLADALDKLAQVQEAKGELVAASDTINRAAAVAEELKDQKLLLFIYMGRGRIIRNFPINAITRRARRPSRSVTTIWTWPRLILKRSSKLPRIWGTRAWLPSEIFWDT